jgi:hypothetical protein
VQEGRNEQYNGILHATRTILREVSSWQQQQRQQQLRQ